MKKTLTTSQIADELRADFSYAAAHALAEWLEDYEDQSGEEMEMDAVAIRCDWNEYASLPDWADDYFSGGIVAACEACGIDPGDLDGEDPSEDETLLDALREYVTDNGQLVEFDGGVIVSAF